MGDPDEALSIGQIELLDIKTVSKQTTYELLEIDLFDHLMAFNAWCLIELLVIHSNNWNHLTVWKNWAQARLKTLSTKCVSKSYIFIICINEIWLWIT